MVWAMIPFNCNMIAWMRDSGHGVVRESYFDGDTLTTGGQQDFNLTGGLLRKSGPAFASDFG